MLKSTLSLGQIVVLFDVMLIVGVTFVVTTIVVCVLAVAGLAQLKLLTIVILTISPFTKALPEYVFAPAAELTAP